ncbi:MAG: ATP:cob(I)alamin adenosyltransferase [Acidimicrobiales bacterium]
MEDVQSGRVSVTTKTGDDGTTGLLFGGRVRKDDVIIEAVGSVDEAQVALGTARAYLRGLAAREVGSGSRSSRQAMQGGGGEAGWSACPTTTTPQGDAWGTASPASLSAKPLKSNASSGNASSGNVDAREFDALLVSMERDLWVLMAEVSGLHKERHQLVPGKTCITEAMVDSLEVAGEKMAHHLHISKGFAVPGESMEGALLDNARVAARKAERRVVALAMDSESQAGKYLNRLSDLLWILARLADGRPLMARESS